MGTLSAVPVSKLEELAEVLYGDAAYEVVKAMTKEQKDKALQNIAIGTNAVGSVAGPAAIGLAWRARKTGGMPREAASSVAPRMKRSKSKGVARIGRKMEAGADYLNNPKTPRASKLAAAAGAGLIGMQTINWGGDMLSAKLINEQKKKDQVKKNMPDQSAVHVNEPLKLKLLKKGTATSFNAARKAPVAKQKLKAMPKPPIDALEHVSKSDEMDVLWQGEISKMDTDKRQVFGWASIIEINGKPIVDLQGDFMDVEEIEKAAYDYVLNSRKGGNQHEKGRHVSDLVESFVLTPEKKSQMGLPDEMPTGWWVGFKVNDDETWSQVKNGERKEFSIHGSGVRKSVELES